MHAYTPGQAVVAGGNAHQIERCVLQHVSQFRFGAANRSAQLLQLQAQLAMWAIEAVGTGEQVFELLEVAVRLRIIEFGGMQGDRFTGQPAGEPMPDDQPELYEVMLGIEFRMREKYVDPHFVIEQGDFGANVWRYDIVKTHGLFECLQDRFGM